MQVTGGGKEDSQGREIKLHVHKHTVPEQRTSLICER